MTAPRKAGPAPLLAGALVLAALAASFRGRTASAPSPSGASATAYVYVADWSGSTAPIRRRLLGATLAEIESLPPGTRVMVYRMGSSTQEVYDGGLGESGTDALAAALARDALPSDPKRGTDFPRMTQALATFSRSFTGSRFLVRVLTDGGDDRAGDRKAQAEYRRAASELCADRRLAELAFVGVGPGFREGIRQAFGTAGARLRLLGPGEGLGP